MAAAAILNNQKLTYLRHGLRDFDEIWHREWRSSSFLTSPIVKDLKF